MTTLIFDNNAPETKVENAIREATALDVLVSMSLDKTTVTTVVDSEDATPENLRAVDAALNAALPGLTLISVTHDEFSFYNAYRA